MFVDSESSISLFSKESHTDYICRNNNTVTCEYIKPLNFMVNQNMRLYSENVSVKIDDANYASFGMFKLNISLFVNEHLSQSLTKSILVQDVFNDYLPNFDHPSVDYFQIVFLPDLICFFFFKIKNYGSSCVILDINYYSLTDKIFTQYVKINPYGKYL